jgi:hypothetical protein
MSFSQLQWNNARKMYEEGKAPSHIADTFGMSLSQISRRVKQDRWEKPDEFIIPPITEIAFKKAAEVIERAEVLEIENTEKESEFVFELRKKARAVQSELLDLILEAKAAMQEFIKIHPDGTYIKKIGKETSYGLVSEIFQPMAALLNASNAITQVQRPINLTTNNQFNQNTDIPMVPPAINIEIVGK